MSSPQPKSQEATSAARSVRRAKQQPTIENVVTAMEAIHSDVAILKDQVESLLPLKSEVAVLKEHVESLLPLKGDVRKLLNHFGLVAGDAP